MPRGVLSWLKCSLCGRSPAVESCSKWEEGAPLCSYCASALRWLGVCGDATIRKRPSRQVDVNERLLESLRSRGKSRNRSARRGRSRV